MKLIVKIFNGIDRFTDWAGKIFCVSLLIIMGIQVLEVVLRYVFNSPTVWAWDVNGQVFSAAAMMAGAYAFLHDSHVRLDILYRNWSDQKKTVVDIITYPLVCIAMGFVIWQGLDMAVWAFKTGERAHSYLRPIVWPVKSFLPLAAILLFLQCLVKWGRTLMIVFGVETCLEKKQ